MRLLQQNESILNTNNRYLETTSERYKFISNKDIMTTLSKYGCNYEGTTSAKVYKQEKQGYQKHISVFNTPFNLDDNNSVKLLLLNDHSGQFPLTFNVGIYRTICANGLVVGQDLLTSKIRHLGNINQKMELEVERLFDTMPMLQRDFKLMNERILNDSEIVKLCDNVGNNLISHLDNVVNPKIIDLAIVRREQDKKKDLYTAFNVIQENACRYGITYDKLTLDNDNNWTTKTMKTRPTKGIRNLEVNKMIYNEVIKLVA
jgi:hypothetical protein